MSDGTIVTPRITAAYLDSFVNRHIIVVGKVLQVQGNQATLDSDGTVNVILDSDAQLISGNAAEVVGKVNPDLTIKSFKAQDLGSNVDLSLYSSVVEATHRHKEIFLSES